MQISKLQKSLNFALPIIGIGFAFLFFKSLCVRIVDYDLWWHLASGREMIERRLFLREDIFSHTYLGQEWVNFEWLGQIALYAIDKFFGVPGLFYGRIILGLSVIAMVAHLLRSHGARGIGLLASVCAAFIALRPRLNERIELASLILIPVFVYFLSVARNRPPSSLKRTPWILFGLMIVWCNLHAGFIYGIGVAVLFNVGSRWAKEEKKYTSMLNTTLFLLCLATLLNPFGPKLVEVFGAHIGQFQEGLHVIQEWAPPSIRDIPAFWALFVLAAAALVTGLVQRRPEATFWAPAVVVFAVGGAVSYRAGPLAVFVLLPFLVEMFSKWEKLAPLRSSELVRLGGSLAAVVILVSQSQILAKEIPDEKVQWNRFPAGACRFVDEQNINGKMYNTYEFGGYIQWALGPERKVMMDGRYLFHPILVEHDRLNRDFYTNPESREWPHYLDRLGIDYAITDYGAFVVPVEKSHAPFQVSPLNAMFPRSAWALVYWDDAALVFVKRSSTSDPLIAKFEYRHLWPYNLDQMRTLIQTQQLTGESVKSELDRHRSETGFTVIGSEIEKLIPAGKNG